MGGAWHCLLPVERANTTPRCAPVAPTERTHPAAAPAVADARQRNLMAAEFYGKEYVLFEGGTLNNAEGGCVSLGSPCLGEARKCAV